MTEVQIGTVRRFNRSYTLRIGALEDSFLGTGLPLAAARLLYEIGARGGHTRQLRSRLGLDSGYLSRLLRRLEADGLVRMEPDPDDGRRRMPRLTTTGLRAWDGLERRSAERARVLIEPLSERQRERLAGALSTADLLVRAATVEFITVEPDSADARRALSQYFAELQQRFPDGFDAATEWTRDGGTLGSPAGEFVVAGSDGEPVACGGIYALTGQIAEVKRMWVHPDWRGAGLGSRLLRHLESRASDLGHRCIRLDTHDSLTEAIAAYRRAGYVEIAPYNDNPYARVWFEKQLS